MAFVSLYKFWTRAHAKLFTLLARGDFRRLGRRSTIQPPIRLEGVQHIDIGEQVFIGSHSWLEVLDPDRLRHTAAIRLGPGTSISGHCTISAAQSVIIESNVLIARYVYISDHAHAHAAVDVPIKDQGIVNVAPVRIGEGAWLGQGVVICPGVTIGRNAVIGANSVVRHDVPEYSVAAGVPARVIRSVQAEAMA